MTKLITAIEGELYTNLKQVSTSFQFDILCPPEGTSEPRRRLCRRRPEVRYRALRKRG